MWESIACVTYEEATERLRSLLANFAMQRQGTATWSAPSGASTPLRAAGKPQRHSPS